MINCLVVVVIVVPVGTRPVEAGVLEAGAAEAGAVEAGTNLCAQENIDYLERRYLNPFGSQ